MSRSLFSFEEVSYERAVEESRLYTFYFSGASPKRFAEMSEDEAHELAGRELGVLVLERICGSRAVD